MLTVLSQVWTYYIPYDERMRYLLSPVACVEKEKWSIFL